MSHGVGDLKDALLRHETVDLVSRDDVTLLERFDGKILPTTLILG